jgi:transcriptional regulator with XRE-family HTH domain
MRDAFSSLDYGEQLVMRYRASGLTRKEFAEQSGISVSTLAYYVQRERRVTSPSGYTPNRIVPVDLVLPEEDPSRRESPYLPGGIAIRLANGRAVEVQRGFDAQLLCDVLAVLEENRIGERG